MHENKYIFTPGPVKMADEIISVGGKQTPYFRNREFSQVLLECEQKLISFANAPQGSRVIFLTGSGSAAMEAAVINFFDSGRKHIVINGGGFGQRFVDIAQLRQFDIYDVRPNLCNLSDVSGLDEYTDASVLCVNGHETSIGLLYDLDAIGRFCHSNGILNIVDAISLFVTDPIDMQKQFIDVLLIGSQKGLALDPGLSMIILSPKAITQIQPTNSLYFGFQNYLKDGLRGQTPFTPAVSVILQLHQRLNQIEKHGITEEQKKAREVAEYFRQAIKPLPLKAYTEYLPNALTALTPTDDRKAGELVELLDKRYDVIVTPNGGPLADVVFRVSHMGDMNIEYIDHLINALYDIYGVKR